jgi:hypothetical protein
MEVTMWGCLLVLGWMLAGQVTGGADRDSGNNSGSRQPDATSSRGQGPISNEETPVPMLGTETSAADTAVPFGTAPPPGVISDPYDSATTPIGSSSTRGSQIGDGAATPLRTAPPALNGLPSRSPAGAGARTAAPPSTIATDGIKPSALMREMLTPPSGSRLSGQPMSLAEVVATAGSRAEQTQRVEAYWDLCSSVADYFLGLREQQELRELVALAPRIGPTLQQAEQDIVVRIGTSQRAAMASQYRLASLIDSGPSSLPLPRDIPHCGDLQSHYHQIFAGRPSAEAQELSVLLPLRYEELKNAAVSVKRAEEFVLSVASATNSNSDRAGTANALALLALHRRAFVQIARDYNRRIARYSELATPGEIDSGRLVRMLILTSGQSTATRTSVPQVLPSRQSSSSEAEPQNTFADDWEAVGDTAAGVSATRDANVARASAELEEGPREERSLLVKPQ